MFEMPEDIVKFFFEEIHKKGKYEVSIYNNMAFIKPRIEEESYKPVIVVKDIEELRIALLEFSEALTRFYSKYNIREKYHDLSYFFNNLLFNMSYSDAEDLTKFIYKRTAFLQNDMFNEYTQKTLISEIDGTKYYVKRVVEKCGFETPFVLIFEMEKNGNIYPLPLIRYAIDSDNVCHLFTVQYGKNREFVDSSECKNIVNSVNTGVNKYRNTSPSFVLSLALFTKILQENNISNIVVPGFLFSRYRHYYKATSEVRSNIILNRILNNFITLLQRTEYEIEGFNITSYPDDVDSNTHIKLGELNSKNQFVKNIIKKDNRWFK